MNQVIDQNQAVLEVLKISDDKLFKSREQYEDQYEMGKSSKKKIKTINYQENKERIWTNIGLAIFCLTCIFIIQKRLRVFVPNIPVRRYACNVGITYFCPQGQQQNVNIQYATPSKVQPKPNQKSNAVRQGQLNYYSTMMLQKGVNYTSTIKQSKFLEGLFNQTRQGQQFAQKQVLDFLIKHNASVYLNEVAGLGDKIKYQYQQLKLKLLQKNQSQIESQSPDDDLFMDYNKINNDRIQQPMDDNQKKKELEGNRYTQQDKSRINNIKADINEPQHLQEDNQRQQFDDDLPQNLALDDLNTQNLYRKKRSNYDEVGKRSKPYQKNRLMEEDVESDENIGGKRHKEGLSDNHMQFDDNINNDKDLYSRDKDDKLEYKVNNHHPDFYAHKKSKPYQQDPYDSQFDNDKEFRVQSQDIREYKQKSNKVQRNYRGEVNDIESRSTQFDQDYKQADRDNHYYDEPSAIDKKKGGQHIQEPKKHYKEQLEDEETSEKEADTSLEDNTPNQIKIQNQQQHLKQPSGSLANENFYKDQQDQLEHQRASGKIDKPSKGSIPIIQDYKKEPQNLNTSSSDEINNNNNKKLDFQDTQQNINLRQDDNNNNQALDSGQSNSQSQKEQYKQARDEFINKKSQVNSKVSGKEDLEDKSEGDKEQLLNDDQLQSNKLKKEILENEMDSVSTDLKTDSKDSIQASLFDQQQQQTHGGDLGLDINQISKNKDDIGIRHDTHSNKEGDQEAQVDSLQNKLKSQEQEINQIDLQKDSHNLIKASQHDQQQQHTHGGDLILDSNRNSKQEVDQRNENDVYNRLDYNLGTYSEQLSRKIQEQEQEITQLDLQNDSKNFIQASQKDQQQQSSHIGDMIVDTSSTDHQQKIQKESLLKNSDKEADKIEQHDLNQSSQGELLKGDDMSTRNNQKDGQFAQENQLEQLEYQTPSDNDKLMHNQQDGNKRYIQSQENDLNKDQQIQQKIKDSLKQNIIQQEQKRREADLQKDSKDSIQASQHDIKLQQTHEGDNYMHIKSKNSQDDQNIEKSNQNALVLQHDTNIVQEQSSQQQVQEALHKVKNQGKVDLGPKNQHSIQQSKEENIEESQSSLSHDQKVQQISNLNRNTPGSSDKNIGSNDQPQHSIETMQDFNQDNFDQETRDGNTVDPNNPQKLEVNKQDLHKSKQTEEQDKLKHQAWYESISQKIHGNNQNTQPEIQKNERREQQDTENIINNPNQKLQTEQLKNEIQSQEKDTQQVNFQNDGHQFVQASLRDQEQQISHGGDLQIEKKNNEIRQKLQNRSNYKINDNIYNRVDPDSNTQIDLSYTNGQHDNTISNRKDQDTQSNFKSKDNTNYVDQKSIEDSSQSQTQQASNLKNNYDLLREGIGDWAQKTKEIIGNTTPFNYSQQILQSMNQSQHNSQLLQNKDKQSLNQLANKESDLISGDQNQKVNDQQDGNKFDIPLEQQNVRNQLKFSNDVQNGKEQIDKIQKQGKDGSQIVDTEKVQQSITQDQSIDTESTQQMDQAFKEHLKNVIEETAVRKGNNVNSEPIANSRIDHQQIGANNEDTLHAFDKQVDPHQDKLQQSQLQQEQKVLREYQQQEQKQISEDASNNQQDRPIFTENEKKQMQKQKVQFEQQAQQEIAQMVIEKNANENNEL